MKAIREGKVKDEIFPIPLPTKKGEPTLFDSDEGPRDTDLQALVKLKPAFKEGGVVTAANSSKISDGASALVLMSHEKAKALGVKPMAKGGVQAAPGVELGDVL